MENVSRRDVLKRGAALGLAVGTMNLLVPKVEASKAWCRVDPILWYVDGSKAKVSVMMAVEHEQFVTGDVSFEVLCPEDNYVVNVVKLPGLNGYGEDVNVLPGWPGYAFEVYVPASVDVPVFVSVKADWLEPDPSMLYVGATNIWIATY